jgi:WD40 repeat protein
VWDLRDGSQRGTLPKPAKDLCGVRCLRLADGTPVAVAHGDISAIQTWDLRDHKLLHNLSDDSTFEKAAPVVLPDGTPLVLASDWEGPIRALDLKNGKTRFRLTGHTERACSIDTAVLPDGTPVAVSAGRDKTIRVWDLRQRTLLHTIAGLVYAKDAVVCTSLPDGTPVVVASDLEENTMAWDLRDGAALPYRRALRGDILGAVALPDQTLIVGLADDYSSVGVQRLA